MGLVVYGVNFPSPQGEEFRVRIDLRRPILGKCFRVYSERWVDTINLK